MSPEVAAKYLEREEADYRTLLPRVKAPTLVLHRGNRYAPMDQARAAALLFPNCRFVPLDGDIYHFLFGDLSYVDTIIDFLDEDRRRPRAEGLPSGTAIILFADIADSTGLTERLGDRAFRERSKTLDETLRAVIRETGGRPIEGKLLGDGLMAVFASAREAIECGLRCRDTSEASELRLHLGIHAGDVIDEGDNVYGGAVNIASRVAGASEPGEVLVSDIVRGLARTSAEVSFLDRGERELKGVSDPVRLYEVRWRD
jgi:class 3 adenylate cyclase